MSRLPPAPTPPRPPSRPPFPLIAVIAPVVGALAIGAIMRSPFVLVFAILSPLIAIATMVDGRRQARTHRRAEAARFDRECLAFDAAVDAAHREEAHRARARLGDARAGSEGSAPVLIGTAPARSSVAGDLTMPLGDDEPAERLKTLIARASENPALPALVSRGAVTLVGRGLAVDALERRLGAEQGVVVHRVASSHAESSATNISDTAGSVIEVRSATRAQVREGNRVVEVRAIYDSADGDRDALGESSGEPQREHEIPDRVMWESLAGEREGFAVPVGRDAHGVVTIDLVSGGPHAIIGGTTGSGKSELLRSLALGWAAGAPPAQAQLLFVDFKGGATFAGLTELPHSAGIVTDLDGAGATRVLQSLRTEVRRRERLLADHHARDVRERPDLMPRLLVLIDEYAAMLEAHPELAPLIADLVARGRSLGLHLVLCTQAPGAAVRDAVAANCPVRVSFRVTEPSAASFLGRAAPDLLGVAPGRALAVGVVTTHDGGHAQPGRLSATDARPLQVAVVSDADIEHVCARWAGVDVPSPPWLPPLPIDVDLSMVREADDDAIDASDLAGALLLGLVDRPDEQRRTRAVWRPRRDGTLGIIGAARSGRSTTMAVIARSGRDEGLEPVVLSRELPDAWASLEGLRESTDRVLLLADDFDALISRARDCAADLLELWDDAVMAVLDHGGAVALSLSPAAAIRGPIASRLMSKLVLRTADAEEHALLGGPRGGYDREAPPGRGWWAGRPVQIIHEPEALGAPQRLAPPAWRPDRSTDVAIVCRRPDRISTLLRSEQPQYDITTDVASALAPVSAGDVALHPRAFLGTPGVWQSAWSSLQSWRARSEVIMVDVTPAEARSLLGTRGALPPLDVARGDVWVVSPGEGPRRRRWSALAPRGEAH